MASRSAVTPCDFGIDTHHTSQAATGDPSSRKSLPPNLAITVGFGNCPLAGLILNNQRAMVKSIAELRKDFGAFGERVARLEGFMEGIRDAIAGKAA